MNFKNKKTLFENLSDKTVIIWGARMTGIGALRQLRNRDIHVANFIDSDEALINNLVIYVMQKQSGFLIKQTICSNKLKIR